jgi:hypothetical protein
MYSCTSGSDSIRRRIRSGTSNSASSGWTLGGGGSEVASTCISGVFEPSRSSGSVTTVSCIVTATCRVNHLVSEVRSAVKTCALCRLLDLRRRQLAVAGLRAIHLHVCHLVLEFRPSSRIPEQSQNNKKWTKKIQDHTFCKQKQTQERAWQLLVETEFEAFRRQRHVQIVKCIISRSLRLVGHPHFNLCVEYRGTSNF